MKEQQEIIIFDNYYSGEAEENARAYILENSDEYKSADEIPESKVWDEMAEEERENWDDFKYYMVKYLEDHSLLLTGTAGTWQGEREGGTVIKTFDDFYKFWKGCDYIKVWEQAGHLFIKASHHDGTNHDELFKLTAPGLQYLENHSWDDDRETHRTIKSCNIFHGLPHFSETMFN
jgi:hypothetical protein